MKTLNKQISYMKRLKWLFLLPLLAAFISCSYLDEYEEEIEKIAEEIVPEDTTGTCSECVCPVIPANAKVVLWLGHSIGDGRGESISVVPDSTLWLVSKSGQGIEMVTGQTTSNDGNYGSTVRPFAVHYKNYTGDPLIVINRCSGGSDVCSVADKDDWSTTGMLWAPSVDATRKALRMLGRDTTDLLVIVLEIGVNDALANKPKATIKVAYQDLINRIKAAFPGVQILLSQQAKVAGNGNSAVYQDMRYVIREMMQENVGVDIAMSDANLVGPNLFLADGTHPNTAGNNVKAASLIQWFKNRDLGYSRWANAVLSTQFDEHTTARKNLIANFIDGQISNGNYFKYERLLNFKTTTFENIFCDWTLTGYTSHSKITYTQNVQANQVAGNGGFYTWVTPSTYTHTAAVDNFVTAVKITSRTTSITSLSYLFGGGDATGRIAVQQNGAGLNFYANDLTASTGLAADVGFIPGNTYGVYRNGTEKGLLKNTTVAATATVPFTAAPNEQVAIGGARLSGNMASTLLSGFEYFFNAPYVGFDYNNAVSELNYLNANW